MEPAAASRLLTVNMRERVTAIEDFDVIVRLHWPRIFRFVLASLRDRDAAQTVTQDCFLKAYRARGRFRGEASLQTWLMQIAVNLVRDHARNRRLQFWKRAETLPAEVGFEGSLDPERTLLRKEQVESIWSATARLPERQRTVFLLRFVEEMELLEIVAVTGLTEGAVKVHLFRALRAVRARVGRLR
jgi:RNA polymerase sigma-70 factor (ECF subfamily)